MKTKLKSMMLMGVLFITANSCTQQGNGNQPSVEERLNKVISIIENKIEITDSQKKVIETAFTEFFKQADKKMKQGERPDKSVIDTLEKDRDFKIEEVLSEDQYKTYLMISAQLRPNRNKTGERPPKQN